MLRKAFVFFVLFSSMIALGAETRFDGVKVTSVYDGDTFKVTLPGVNPFFGQNLGVRIYGIDAPELHTKNACEKAAALKAKGITEALLKSAKTVSLRNIKKDKYFRIVADVYADNIRVSEVLLSKNLAYPYFGATKEKKNWCGIKNP